MLFNRAASTPSRGVHVWSFSPALRFDRTELSKTDRSSTAPKSRWNLFKPGESSAFQACLLTAGEITPSDKTQNTQIMTAGGFRNFGHRARAYCPTTWLHMPPSSPKASSKTSHRPRHGIGRDQECLRSDWTMGFFFNWASYSCGATVTPSGRSVNFTTTPKSVT